MRIKGAKVSDPHDFSTCSGDTERIEYAPLVNPDGTIDLKPCGTIVIQEYIDSFRDQTDMSYIISRIEMGDDSVLNPNPAMYGDFTNMPKTYAEVLQLVMDKEAQFMELPLEVRNQFDNDFRKWFATSGEEVWFEKMTPVLPKEETPIEEVTKE